MRQSILIIFIGLILTFVVYPSAFLNAHTTLPDNNDDRLIAYIIGQTQQNLFSGRPLSYGTFFAPYQNTLSYSEPFLTSALLTFPLYLLKQSSIFIFNLAFIANSILTFTCAYLLFGRLTHKKISATFAAAGLFLTGYHLTFLPHLQVFSIWPVLLSLYFLAQFQNRLANRYFFFFLLAVTIQMAESLFPVYLIFFSSLLLFLKRPRRLPLKLAFYFLPLWLFLLVPYLQFHFSFPEAYRPIRDAAHNSLGLDQVFTQFHSLTLVFLFLISFLFTKKRGPWFWLALFAFVMSLGPVVKIGDHSLHLFGLPLPLPYSLFYYLFPGFTAFRTPSRFILLAALAAFAYLTQNKVFNRFLPALAIILFIIAESHPPLPSYPVDITPPPVYAKVAALPPDAIILELPVKLWNAPDHEIESLRSLYSLVHLHRRFGGYSGFAPTAWIDLVNRINSNGLNDENLDRLKQLGITHIVTNNQLYPISEPPKDY